MPSKPVSFKGSLYASFKGGSAILPVFIGESPEKLRNSLELTLRLGGELGLNCVESQHLARHFLKGAQWKLGLWKPRPEQQQHLLWLSLARPLHQRQRQDARPGNSHRIKANFPGKLPGFLQAPVTEATAKSASGVLAAAVGPSGREPPLQRSGSSRKGPGLKFKIHFPPRPDSRPRPGLSSNPSSPNLPSPG